MARWSGTVTCRDSLYRRGELQDLLVGASSNRPSRTNIPELQDLKNQTTGELALLWQHLYGTAPPTRIRRETILRFVSFKVQEIRKGGLSKPSISMIKSLQKQFEASRAGQTRSHEVLYPGVRIVRDWRGERHEVKVLESGFEYQEKQYRSLTAIATTITGTKRSGPLFFGLREDGK